MEELTGDHIAELSSWFDGSSEGNEFIEYYKNPEEWLKLVESRPERHAFVTTDHGWIVGFADIEFDDDGDVSFAFGIKPEMRGKGFGKKLLDQVISYAKKCGARTIQGGVDRQNTACIKLLQSEGFSPAVFDNEIVQYIKALNNVQRRTRLELPEIVDKLAPLVAENPNVHAMWLEGSYATGKNHEGSDIDVWLDVDDGFFDVSLDDFRSKLTQIVKIKSETTRGIYSDNPKLMKQTFILEGFPEGQDIELDLQEHSRNFVFSHNKHVIKVLFDKDNTVKWDD